MPPAAPAVASKWSDLGVRFASAIVLGPLVLLALWHGGLAWVATMAVMLAGLGVEWARLVKAGGAVLLLPAGLLAVLALTIWLGSGAGLLALAVLTLLLAWRFGWRLGAGAPYAGLGGIALLWLRLSPHHGLLDTLFLVAVIWATDIGAYVFGRLIGGAKLAPRISPGKTWSGAAGGLACAGAAGLAVSGFDARALLASLLLSLFAQGGDLLESAIKRKLGVKDSGRTIPGHGGLFDRLDGVLTAAPIAGLLVLLVQGSMPA